MQQYCKLLCHTNRVNDAQLIWEDVGERILPAEYKIPIHVEILIWKEGWFEALEIFRHLPDSHNIHLIGMRKEVFLAWAKSESDEMRRQEIANQGLDIKVDPEFETDIAYLITSARLARLAGRDDLYNELESKLDHINAKVAELLRRGEDQLLSWED